MNDLNEASCAKMKERALARLDEWIAASREQKWPPDIDAIQSAFLQRAKYLGVSYEVITSDHPDDFVKQISNRNKKKALKHDQLWYHLQDHVWRKYRDDFGSQFQDQFWSQFQDQFWNHLRDQLWDHLRNNLRNNLRNQRLGCQLRYQFWNQLWKPEIVYDCIWCSLAEKDKARIKNYNMYMLEAFKNGMFGWLTPKGYVFVLLAPPYTLDAQRRLHNEDSCALEWPNGTKQYWYHGVEVPKEVILDPRSLSKE